MKIGIIVFVMRQWVSWVEQKPELWTTNYVLVECQALLQRRFGMSAVTDLQERFLPLIRTHWITLSIHERPLSLVIAYNRRDLSLVDCTSFIVIHELGLNTIFTFDVHFADQDFSCLPAIPRER